MTVRHTGSDIPEEICGEECYKAADTNRREFGALMLGAGLAAATASLVSAAAAVTETDVEIKTQDGTCDAVLLHPGSGSYPGVIIWPDIAGLRPAFRDMGRRLAAEGYAVLVPNPFYRTHKGLVPSDIAPEARAKNRAAIFAPDAPEGDTRAFVAFLDSQPAMRRNAKIGLTGYCMGGPLTFRSAATVPERFAAAGSFHGGGLATDQPDSPHLLIPKIRAKYIVAVAENDDQRQPEAKTILKAAFEAAKNPAEIEVYAGANHGWCVPGSSVYNEAQAERAWSRLMALYKANLT